ncbi:MAG: hypothetical protein AB1521_16505 [Bacteroidota bacterium]
MKEFKYPLSEKIAYAIGTAFFLGLIIFLRNNPQSTILVNGFFTVFGLLSFIAFCKSLGTITLTDYSIIRKYPLISETEIQFKDIYSVAEFNDSLKFVLKDYSNNKLLTIEKTIVGIRELKEEIKNKLANQLKVKPQDYFPKSNGFFASFFFMIILVLGTVGLFIYEGNMLGASISFLMSVIIFFIVGKQPIFIYLNYSHITIKSIFKTNKIFMTDISDIIQETDEKTKAGSVTYTVIKLSDNKDISLLGFKPDDELLFQSCKYYFNNKTRAT